MLLDFGAVYYGNCDVFIQALMTLPSHRYRDPLDILIAEEARTCRGCHYEHVETLWGQVIKICKKVMDNGKRRQHGKRCRDYLEG